MRQGNLFNLENIVSHLPGRDTSLRWMFSSGVPLKAPATRRGENLAITITAVSTDVVPLTISRYGHCCRCRRIPFLWPSVHQIHFCEFPNVCRQEPSERTATNIWQRCLVFNARFETSCSNIHKPPARFVFVFQRVAVIFVNCVKTEHRLLGAPGAKTEPGFRQSVGILPSASKGGYVFLPLDL